MGYTKFILSGDTLETYEYENEPPQRRKMGRPRKDDSDDSVLSPSRANVDPTKTRTQANAIRSATSFRRLLLANFQGVENPVLFTLTYRENTRDISEAARDFTSFIQALRYRFGKGFKYVAVPEFQKRGAVHFHALFWGLPQAVLLQERQTRTLAQLWSWGFIDVVFTDGSPRIASYLAKYMAKAFLDYRLFGRRAYYASRSMNRPIIVKGLTNVSLDYVLEEYDIDLSTDVSLELERSHETMYLGRSNYKKYNLRKYGNATK